MKRWLVILLLVPLAGCNVKIGPGGNSSVPRNPFGLKDIQGSPDDAEVKKFAAQEQLSGDDQDANAKQWVDRVTPGDASSLDGDWYGIWLGSQSQPATIKTVKGRVYFLERDGETNWMLECVYEGKNKLIGRWINASQPDESGYFVGLVVSSERIDGIWTSGGARWDFRRRLK